MAMLVIVPLVVLVIGGALALRADPRNRGLIIGATIVLAVIGFVAVVARDPTILK